MRMLLMLLTIGLFGILVMQLLFKQEQEAHGNIQATAQDILEHNKEADIFQYNDHVYINVESMENIKTNDFQKRSEEHTSELQSRGHLVCRLLLEKKKKKQDHSIKNQT